MRGARAAGKLAVGFWDHWVPGANAPLEKLCREWAEKEKVELKIDFITSNGDKDLLTVAAEAQAKTGHDIYAFDQWTVQQYADSLDPMDDVMQRLIAKYGKLGRAYEYLGVVDKHWKAVPVGWGSAPLTPCGRVSLLKKFANFDVQAMYPAHETAPDAGKEWTYEAQLKMAEACFKGGFPIGFGCGSGSTDANQTWGATFGAFGAHLVDAKGNITVDSDPVREVLDYVKRFVPYLPRETISYDDASNNKAFVAGSAALIWNPPSAWAVAKRDAPAIAADTWHFPTPRGKAGRLVPHRPYFWGIWQWSKNKQAAKDLITFLSQRDIVSKLSVPAAGYDIPPFLSMADLPVWAELEPPKGTVYNYPLRPHHDAEYYIVGSSGPPDVGVQIWSQSMIPGMVARMVTGQTAKQVIDWAKGELEGIRR
jgi:ABC-type glycerol-3-phosphate transport system substrate-binding protein